MRMTIHYSVSVFYTFKKLVGNSEISVLMIFLDTPVINPPPPEILKPTFGASLLPNEEDFRGITTVTSKNNVKATKSRSSAAQTIIDSFPLLDFMQSSILSLEAVKKS